MYQPHQTGKANGSWRGNPQRSGRGRGQGHTPPQGFAQGYPKGYPQSQPQGQHPNRSQNRLGPRNQPSTNMAGNWLPLNRRGGGGGISRRQNRGHPSGSSGANDEDEDEDEADIESDLDGNVSDEPAPAPRFGFNYAAGPTTANNHAQTYPLDPTAPRAQRRPRNHNNNNTYNPNQPIHFASRNQALQNQNAFGAWTPQSGRQIPQQQQQQHVRFAPETNFLSPGGTHNIVDPAPTVPGAAADSSFIDHEVFTALAQSGAHGGASCIGLKKAIRDYVKESRKIERRRRAELDKLLLAVQSLQCGSEPMDWKYEDSYPVHVVTSLQELSSYAEFTEIPPQQYVHFVQMALQQQQLKQQQLQQAQMAWAQQQERFYFPQPTVHVG